MHRQDYVQKRPQSRQSSGAVGPMYVWKSRWSDEQTEFPKTRRVADGRAGAVLQMNSHTHTNTTQTASKRWKQRQFRNVTEWRTDNGRTDQQTDVAKCTVACPRQTKLEKRRYKNRKKKKQKQKKKKQFPRQSGNWSVITAFRLRNFIPLDQN